MGEEMEYCLPLGCEKRPSALVWATVAVAGWLYELPLDGRREFAPNVPPVEGRAVEDVGIVPKAA